MLTLRPHPIPNLESSQTQGHWCPHVLCAQGTSVEDLNAQPHTAAPPVPSECTYGIPLLAPAMGQANACVWSCSQQGEPLKAASPGEMTGEEGLQEGGRGY